MAKDVKKAQKKNNLKAEKNTQPKKVVKEENKKQLKKDVVKEEKVVEEFAKAIFADNCIGAQTFSPTTPLPRQSEYPKARLL